MSKKTLICESCGAETTDVFWLDDCSVCKDCYDRTKEYGNLEK